MSVQSPSTASTEQSGSPAWPAAMLRSHTRLTELAGADSAGSGGGTSAGDHGRADELQGTYHRHLCVLHDDEGAGELDAVLHAWRALGRSAALWREVQVVVDDHIERAEARFAHAGETDGP